MVFCGHVLPVLTAVFGHAWRMGARELTQAGGPSAVNRTDARAPEIDATSTIPEPSDKVLNET